MVALVPAFFLAGFGIVSALTDSDETRPNVPGSTREGPAQVTVTVIKETELGEADTEPTADAAGRGPGDGGGAPPVPPSGMVEVDYGRWNGFFELANPSIVHGAEAASVVGELYYFGGVDSPVGLVRVRAWFNDEGGRVVGGTAWESVQSTGEGAEVSGREPLPFEARGRVSEAPAAASLRFTAVECL